jgi:transcriptional regulator with AAA-type ATPase domain/Tfp pilus assembly protein PilF
MHVSKGLYLEAKEIFLEALAAYKRIDDSEGCARTLNHLAYIDHICGNVDSSIDYLKQCLVIYEKLDDHRAYLTLIINLAITYRISGLLDLACKEYEFVKISYDGLQDDNKYQFLIGYSFTRALLGHYQEAFSLINGTRLLSQEYKREKAQYHEYLGWIHILSGDFKEAEKALKSGLELSFKIAPESALISQTKRLLADAYFGLKKYDLAQKFAEEALIVAEKINERAEIAACYRVFAQVALHNGENDKAREWFKKAIDLFAMIKSRYELAVTRYLYATSGLCDNNERIAILYMAREYFLSEEIKPYIDKVDKALSSSIAPKLILKPSGNGAPVFIAVSPKTRNILDKADHFAPTDYTVLITGPTGVGKDQLAKYIHWASGRKGDYLSFNCAAFPETMIEAELFGYSKGAYTDADGDKPGLVELANNGTLCLNEIAETPINFQVKLLDFLETKVIRPIGSTQFKNVDVRIIAATNRDLKELMLNWAFREDLYYRLMQLPIAIPPLSERKEDIPALAEHLLGLLDVDISSDGNGERFDRLCHSLITLDWPGNVRELQNKILNLYELSHHNLGKMIELMERETISERERLLRILEKTGWNRSETARILNISEGTVRNKIRRFRIQDPRLT